VLRVIEYGTFERVGGNEPLAVDVRLIAAANADLPALAEAGKFRSDLLDRLAFDVVTVPPLRARAEDIPLLAEHFARAMTRTLGRDAFAGFSGAAMAQLHAHSWPGNVRELKNAVERSLYRAANASEPLDEIILDPFASPFRPPPAASAPPAPAAEPGDFRHRVGRFEAEMLRGALAEHDFNQRRTAQALGLGYHQLRHYLRKHAIAPHPFRAAGG
jgi:psp operon transcriptional activator